MWRRPIGLVPPPYGTRLGSHKCSGQPNVKTAAGKPHVATLGLHKTPSWTYRGIGGGFDTTGSEHSAGTRPHLVATQSKLGVISRKVTACAVL